MKKFKLTVAACTLWLLFGMSVHGQLKRMESDAFCTSACMHQKTDMVQGGEIYDQDPRVHHYDVKFYGLDLNVKPHTTQISGSVRVVAEITQAQTRYFVLELIDDVTVSAVVHGEEPLSFSQQSEIVEIDLGYEIEAGSLVDIEVFYAGQPQASGFFAGIQTGQNGLGDHVLWTLSEPHNARQWFPCKQVLNDKADSVYVSITTPPGYLAASNGLLEEKTVLSDGRILHQWKSYYPIAYYLVSMAVSNYQEYNFYAPLAHSEDSVFIQNFLYNHPQALEQNKENIDQVKPMMEVLSLLWGDYPFAKEKYGHAHAPMGGAMEHQTISTMGYFGFDITAHELAHHWYGNNVTCASWSDIWINEGFASYGEYLSREFILGKESASQWMKEVHQNVKSSPGGSVYIPQLQVNDVFRIFNGRLSYHKGAAILHQLRFEINDDDLFFSIMEDFQVQFADSVATGEDFSVTVENHTADNWEWFFDQWYYGEGFPIYRINWWQKEGKLMIKSSQTTSATQPSFFAGTLEFQIIAGDSAQIIRLFQNEALQEFEIDIEAEVEQLLFDPSGAMLKNYNLSDSNDVGNTSLPDVLVYPNPFTDHLAVEYPASWPYVRFVLWDLQGRIIWEEKLTSSSLSQDLSTLDAGVYIAGIFSPKGTQKSFRLMKY